MCFTYKCNSYLILVYFTLCDNGEQIEIKLQRFKASFTIA